MASMADNNNSFSGVMFKRGRRLKRVLQRWYTTKDGSLYYADAQVPNPTKRINLTRCTIQSDGDSVYLSGVGDCWPLQIQTDERVHYFMMKSKEDRARWTQVLRAIAVQHSIENVYRIGKVLGKGSFAEVKLAEDKATNQQFAIKIIDVQGRPESEIDMLKMEVSIMRMTQHPNVVQLKEFIETSARFYLVMDFLSGGELFERIVNAPEGHYTEKDACTALQQIMSALVYLHDKRICHRDLKPENFLLADSTPNSVIKIADFGFAAVIPDGVKLTEVCGSPGYLAPEIASHKSYGLECDIWSMGVILYILLTGIPPFAGETDEETMQNTRRGDFDLKPLAIASPAGADLVKQMLQYEPSQRLTAQQTCRHVWLCGDEANNMPLSNAQKNLKSFLARRRFKKAILATVATTKMAHILRLSSSAKKDGENSPKPPN